jgi:hypothetical protein
MPAVNGVGKPCAGEPHARFDGRELETEQRSGQGHGDEGHQGKPCGHQRLRDLPPMLVTAPALDPTSDVVGELLPTSGAGGGNTQAAWRRDANAGCAYYR